MSALNRRLLLCSLGLAWSLLACQHSPGQRPSIRTTPPDGALFALREPVVIPAGSAHVFIQNPQAIGGKGEFYPGCTLEVQSLSNRPQVLRPDRFTITKVEQYQNCYVLTTMNEVRLMGSGVRVAGGGGLSDCWYVTRMWLHSKRQPQVRLLECQRLDDPAIGRYLSLDDIRRTLSPVGDFLRPDGTALPPPGPSRPEY